MKRVCLALPTNRPCAGAIVDVHAEAAFAVANFDVEVHVLILDSCAPAAYAEHQRVVDSLPALTGAIVHHLDEGAQRRLLVRTCARAGGDADKLLDLILPDGLSYGACTNRAFLIAAALGCESVHRRDSDSRYQRLDGTVIHPIHHELRFLGLRGADAVPLATESELAAGQHDRPVGLVAGSFIGEMSVDLAEMREAEPGVYHDVVSLWAPSDWSAEQRDWLVAESFIGGGTEPFAADRARLGTIDMYRVDMCNIALGREVYERVPLPPARDTIGSDYFLIHLVHDSGLPGVVHNRQIVNGYTPERRTEAGFLAYHMRFAKFLLSMLYLNDVYGRMTEAGPALLDREHRVRPDAVVGFVRESLGLDRSENEHRLAVLDTSYRKLGHRYALVADMLERRKARLLDEAGADMADYALLIDSWSGLVEAARTVGL